ncbi:hypothetical protein WICPIJ_005055 [Wickerhamomyces pijperi]|uniref:Uncharacterized protein n=1 Tax=Wickerhamomyces pijperi TaxID=599730 RepID=A0A9P8Q6Q5_WICPI|nr:hypothetical protein WICPIJ_005055 [Wickerhamomyces pijperi]
MSNVKLNINNIQSTITSDQPIIYLATLSRTMKRSLITDRYIPNFSTTYILRRLTLDSIIKILKLWQTLEITQTTRQKQDTLDKFLLRYDTGVGSTIRKAYVIDLVIHLYPKGLNLLHISIFETQLIFESKVTWRRSGMGQSMDINELQGNIGSLLSEELSKLYMNHVYVTRNHYQDDDGFLLIRVQLFDTERVDKLKSQSSIFFIIPQNSSYIVHNSSALFEIELMLQLLSKILGTLIRSETAETVGCLKTILKLNSHGREELGVWNIYNQSDEIDISPFDDLKRHESLVDRTMRLTYEEQCKELSWLRFKGTKRPVEQGGGGEDHYANEYPFQSKTFKITKPTTTNSKTSIKLRFKFKGSDIFAGLHELADLGHLQIQKIPAWMTGENGFTGDSVEEIDETDEIMELKQNSDGNSNRDKGDNYGIGKKGGMLI